MYIDIQGLTKKFKRGEQTLMVLDNISLTINQGEFICLLGPSGCGKTTLLNILAGFENASEGSVLIDGEVVSTPTSRYVTIFQNYGLLPWRNVRHNVELGLEGKKISKSKRKEIAEKYICLVGLDKFANSNPAQLSGGMQQRVAIARALAVSPDIIFMDEPFGALDAMTRMKMQDEILEIKRSQNKTIIFVTHDIDEAVYLADRIIVFSPNPGRIKEIIQVQLKFPRDRNGYDFIRIRDKVFSLFDIH
ncbi:ABC transporter ATP-binding protein [Lacrimispora algidixylanolytica]|uniref:ABC transporter n=1 Tax=Lacrimispora algidixylanolytica TaxID=94868 RepID=A0A419T1L1_9FIRM|nr:ABC transporter ATP-binding protein [Lacrimispora algidixylanolytica]RKD31357.1 ABC transporter [Lacrimispora algidixylanolytica]